MISGQIERGRRDEGEETTPTPRSSAGEPGRTTPGRSPSTDISKGEIFDVLRNGRRRAAIAHLRRHGGEMPVSEVATRVAADEYDVNPEELSSEQYKRVYTGLYQCHFPRAHELGVVDFDVDDNTVRLTSRASALDPFLQCDETTARPRVGLGVAVVTALMVAVGWAGTTLFGIGSPTVLAVLSAGSLLGIALLQF